ncbi:GH36-type glycosyl hydrolase domain-containing protein [Aggregatilinea lenta]|uniref:GH36-type glycosyl hydrolase domain-containing protein n=1 Tax=Aggregatilinea lenta TaxID=913108 RepID=UPI000E5BDB31|nr:glycosyl hydrolase family 65 protein [Aggregatilinea lenta]
MHYGSFDDVRREYVITRPDTPLPWINYLGSEAFFGLISNTAGGYAFYRDARLRRLTRYRYNNAPPDSGGRYLYLRDEATGTYWSPSWMPTRTDLDEYTCRHGLGYTIIESAYRGIRAETRYFVPVGADLEVWQTTITNEHAEPAALSLFGTVEFCLWDAYDDMTNFQRNFNTGQVEIEDGVIYHKTEYRERRDHFAYFACSALVAAYDTQREAFLGAYRGWDAPLAVERGACGDSVAHGWAPIAAQQVKLDLAPGESRTVIFLLGYGENLQDEKFDPPESQAVNKQRVRPVIARYLDPAQADAAFEDLGRYWERQLAGLQVTTPDEHTNRMVNIWNAYQCMVTFNLSRSASYFESGVGRGMGFRDSAQDLLAFVQMDPVRACERLLDLAATQLETGGAYHQYQPLTKKGNDAVGSNFNDDPLWLVLAAAAYVKESGDWSILDASVPYENRPGTEQPFYEHLQRCVQYTLDRLGPHGLPLIGRADWNDCLNLNTFSDTPGESFQTTTNKDGAVAESVLIGGMFVQAANEMADLAARCEGGEAAERYRAVAQQIEAAVREYGWDGAWFLRAYDALGDRVGSHECAEGQIYVEPQGICILAGIGVEDGLAERALESVAERLATPHGILLHQPAYTRYYLNLGEISSYPPGYKENASVFCHTNPWIMIAEAIVGHGDRAFDYYTRISPSAREAISDVHRSEPYVYAQTIAGRDAPTQGEAKNSWLTGTAAWNYVAITEWILGIRATHEGLCVAPVIPEAWSGFTATRAFRGTPYHITVTRKGPGNALALTVNGQPVAGTVVPLAAGPDPVTVEVALGG